MDKLSMNRLLILGNGFDLAHQMKTSYNDFIQWYIKKSLLLAHKEGSFEDGLIAIVRKYPYSNDVEELIDNCFSQGVQEHLYFYDTIGLESGYGCTNPFKITCKSYFLRILLSNSSDPYWVQIENEYYDELKKILRGKNKAEELSSLNRSLSNLILELEEYLKTLETQNTNSAYNEIFESIIQSREVLSAYVRNGKPVETLVLNFNYTSTVEKYFPSPRQETTKINYIHGKIDDPSNPIVFGFGDELDKDYLEMELERTKGFFTYIKSFWYFKTSNYHNLIRFIESNKFQVYILGHSCGLSDRTMLNMIFEHENCKSIKIFYYENGSGYNNYTELTQEISRHFKNKSEMRRKIVPFDMSSPMPQITNSN